MSIRHLLKQHNNLLKNQTENLANRLVRQFHTNLEELLVKSQMDPDIKDDFFRLINHAIKNTNLETDDYNMGSGKDPSHPLPDRYHEETTISLTSLKTLSKQEKFKKDKEREKPKKNKSKAKKPYSFLIESSESDAENDMDDNNDQGRDRNMNMKLDAENETGNDRNTGDESQNLARVTLKTKDFIVVRLNPDNSI